MGPLTCHDTVATQRQTAVRYLVTQYCHTRILLSKDQLAASAGQIGYQMKFKDTPQHSAASRTPQVSERLKLTMDDTKTNAEERCQEKYRGLAAMTHSWSQPICSKCPSSGVGKGCVPRLPARLCKG